MRRQDHNDTALQRENRALWQAARERFAAPPEAEALDPLLLAAYLDGRLTEEERDRVEALLAASPEALETYLAADEALGAAQPAPERLLARAAALVPGEALAPPARRFAWLRGLFGAGPAAGGGFRLQPVTLALTLAAILAVSVAGFEIGRFGYAVAAEEGLVGGDSLASMAELDGLGLAADVAY